MQTDRELFSMLREEMIKEAELNTFMESSTSIMKSAVIYWIMKIRNLDSQIRNEKNIEKKMEIMAQQIKYNAYLNAIGLAFKSNDKSLHSRLKGMR